MPIKTISKFKKTIFLSLILSFSTALYADDVEDSINDGLKSYQEGSYKDAVESLNYATQLIQQKKGEALEALLPEAAKGWIAKKASSQAAATAMFGGGITAKRQYSKDSASISIEFLTDSPMLQSMMMMFSNPMIATSDGGKLEKINRQKAIVKYDEEKKKGEIKLVVDNRYLITVEGRDVSLDDLKKYAKAIDYKKLKAL